MFMGSFFLYSGFFDTNQRGYLPVQPKYIMNSIKKAEERKKGAWDSLLEKVCEREDQRWLLVRWQGYKEEQAKTRGRKIFQDCVPLPVLFCYYSQGDIMNLRALPVMVLFCTLALCLFSWLYRLLRRVTWATSTSTLGENVGFRSRVFDKEDWEASWVK